jgi:hypothetical protein
MVAEGSLEPGKREKAKNSESGRREAEERMGGDSSEDAPYWGIVINKRKKI